MNDAFIMKLGWGVLNRPNDLWVHVVKGKYGRAIINSFQAMVTPMHSRLWNAIASKWPSLIANHRQKLGDDSSICF